MAKPLALTLGEPAGIGPDIAIEAWLRRNELKLPPFYLLGDRDFLGERAKSSRAEHRARRRSRRRCACDAFAERVAGRRHRPSRRRRSPGQPDDTSADAALASIRQAVGDVVAGRAGAVVTNPIAKSVLYRARLPASRPYRISRRTRGRRRPGAAAGHDAVVPCPRRRARDHPSSAARARSRSSPAT